VLYILFFFFSFLFSVSSFLFFFFFSSRRRHTRCYRDWSSDVCSSDLLAAICLFFLYYSDLYAPSSLRNSPAVPPRFIKGLGIACLIVAPVYYLVPSLQLFRGFAITGISVAAILMVSHRQLFFAFNKSNELAEAVVILGEGRMATNVARVVQNRPELGLH